MLFVFLCKKSQTCSKMVTILTAIFTNIATVDVKPNNIRLLHLAIVLINQKEENGEKSIKKMPQVVRNIVYTIILD